MPVGEVRIESDNTFEWHITNFSSLDRGNAHLSKELLCKGIRWRFVLVHVEYDRVCFGIQSCDRRRSLDLLTENFMMIIRNGYRNPREWIKKSRFEMRYQPEKGWHICIDECVISYFVKESDLIISWDLIQDIDSTDVNRWSDLKQLFLRPDSKNMTLFLKGREFQAHKEILIARSSLFKCLLTPPELDEDADSVVLDVDDGCDPDTFQDFLMYLYSPCVEIITTSNVIGLYKTAFLFDVQNLVKECVQFMIQELSMVQELSMDTFFNFAELACDHREFLLAEACTAFFKKHATAISETDEWHSFEPEFPDFAFNCNFIALGLISPVSRAIELSVMQE